MVDFICQRYGCLPSEFVETGDTLDIQTSIIAVGYESWIKKNPEKTNKHGFSQDQLQEMLNSVKNKNT